MTSGRGEPELIRAYLLDRLSAEERDAVGRRLMEDAEFFDQVREQEDDLIDAAARGELDRADEASLSGMLRAGSEEHRLAFARALHHAARRQRHAAIWRYAAVAAGLVIACGGVWVANRNMGPRQGPGSGAPVVREQPASSVYAIFLPAGVTRGPNAARNVRIPPGADVVELQLEAVAETGGPFVVELRNASGTPVSTQRLPGPLRGMLRVPVPAVGLSAGSYEVEVAVESAGTKRPVEFYYFRVE